MNTMWCKCSLWICTLFFVCEEVKTLTFVRKDHENRKLQLEISNGIIQGKKQFTEKKHMTYYSFQGIPYAQPPVQNLRFREPKPPLNWTGILDATVERSACLQMFPQFQIGEFFPSGEEDCLYLNVFTPLSPTAAKPNKLLPVMVWIYGGAFSVGDSNANTYGPDYLVEEDVVVVTFNYRLGMLGFLSTGDMYSPGNYGLKDQVAVLKWVHANIKHFGGDPNLVTIFGQSAGAASVQYLMQTPNTKGLFHRAIAQSGSTLCPWALQKNPARIAFEIGVSSGIVTTSTKELVERLRQTDLSRLKLTQLGAALFENALDSLNGIPFGPTYEPEHEEAVITKRSYHLLQQGRFNRVPYLTGLNSQESVMFVQLLDIGRPLLAQWDLVPQVLVPDNMNTLTLPERTAAAIRIKQHYFGNTPVAISSREDVLEYISDSQFARPIRESAILSSQYVPVYFYMFSYEGYLGASGNSDNGRADRRTIGVAHAEEMWYMWRKENLTTRSNTDNIVRDRVVRMWTNFARFGNPTPEPEPLLDNVTWPQVKPNKRKNVRYLEINSDLTTHQVLKPINMDFWTRLYALFGHMPYDTY